MTAAAGESQPGQSEIEDSSQIEDGADGLPLWEHRERRARKPPLAFGSRGPGSLYRRAKSLLLLATRDRRALADFLLADFPEPFPLAERLRMVRQFVAATDAIRCFHTQAEMFVTAQAILSMGRHADGTGPVVVEAGVAKGASSAKLSLAVGRLCGELHLFDSFRGMPKNDERLTRLDGSEVVFFKGAFTGRIPTVTRNIERFGCPEAVHLHKGLFEETMPGCLPDKIDLALLDVDLLSSTKTCVRHIYPRLVQGGVIFSQDGHIREIADLLSNEDFWRREVGCGEEGDLAEARAPMPRIEGLYRRKFVKIVRP